MNNQHTDATDKARDWLVQWHLERMPEHSHYSQYIRTTLAGDFAFHLASALEALEAQLSNTQSEPTQRDLEQRAIGRSEAAAIILQQDPETALHDCIGSQQGPSGEWDEYWKPEAVHELLLTTDTVWSLKDKAEEEYWHNLGLREEAERLHEMASRATTTQVKENAETLPCAEGSVKALTDERAPATYTITIAKVNMGDDWHATAQIYSGEKVQKFSRCVICKTPEAALAGILTELGEQTQDLSDLEALQMKYGMMKTAYEAELAVLHRAQADEEMTDAERIAYERFHKPEWLECSHHRLRVLLSVCHETITRCGAKIENLQDELAILQSAQPVADKWHEAVLQQCMAVESCYVADDPTATLNNLINWHVLNERDSAAHPKGEQKK